MELQQVKARVQPVKQVLDDAWVLTSRAHHSDERAPAVSTAAILFALCEPQRMRALPGSVTMRYLNDVLEGRWIRLSSQRALFFSHGVHYEPRSSEFGTLSDISRRVVRHARVLAHESGSPRLRMRHLLRALLVQPSTHHEMSSHAVLRDLGLDPIHMACNFLCT